MELVKNVNKDNMVQFEEAEACRLLDKDKFDELKAKTKTKYFSNVVLAADYIWS